MRSEVLKIYKMKIRGITTLVWNRDKLEIRDLVKGLNKDELEEHEKKNWLMKAETNNGNALLPPEWIIGCLVSSAKETRIVPWYATSKNQTYTKYISNIKVSPGKEIVICKTKELKRKDALLPARGKAGGGKVLRCHPIIEKWEAEFEIIDTVGFMKKDELNRLLTYGGRAVGIGDQRLTNFGRFELISLKEVKQ